MSQSPCHYAALSSESRTALGSNVKTRSILEVTEPMHVIASSCYEKFVKNQTLFSYLKKRGTERPALLLTGQLWGFCVYLFIYFFPLRDKPPQNHNFLRASHHSWQRWSFFFFFILSFQQGLQYSSRYSFMENHCGFPHATFPRNLLSSSCCSPEPSLIYVLWYLFPKRAELLGEAEVIWLSMPCRTKEPSILRTFALSEYCTGQAGKPLARTVVVLHMLSSSLASFAW